MRKWVFDKHFRYLNSKKWGPMQDYDGNTLRGIEGMAGTRDQKIDGTHIGADFIKMYPGAEFPLHTHEGDHEIYVIEGSGFIRIDESNIVVSEGVLIHIPAEHPHKVWIPNDFVKPLIFVAMGHPHHQINSRNRMKTR